MISSGEGKKNELGTSYSYAPPRGKRAFSNIYDAMRKR